jgi:hypothetical protein
MRFARRSLSHIFQRQNLLFNRISTAALPKDAISTGRSTFAILRGLFRDHRRALSRVSDALVDKSVAKRRDFDRSSGRR